MYLTIATAGHIDHGKSALVQALTGTNPDRLKEEQARGISIELGFAHAEVGDTTLSFVDVPGHERFVRTMLAGVGGIDAVLLVVAADESVMPQTREHLAICRLLDVPAGVIALTKADLADDVLQAIVADDVRTLVAGSPLADAEIVPVSARTGVGLDALRAALLRCAARRTRRDPDAPVRLPIDRVFSVRGFGTVVTGTLWSGVLSPDDDVRLEPGGRAVRVRSLQVHGAPASRAEAGQRVAVNLAGLSQQEVQRGDVLVGEGIVIVSRRLAVDVQVLGDASPLRHGARLHVHLGTATVLGRLLLPTRDATDGARQVPPGGRALGLLRLESPLPARRGDRVVLRSYSPVTTVGGGVVVDPLPSGRATALSSLSDAHDSDPAQWLEARVLDAGTLGLDGSDLPARCGLAPAVAHALARDVATTGRISGIGAWWIGAAALEVMRSRMLRAVDEAHAADPMTGGVPRATLRALGGRRWRAEVADHVLARLIADGILRGEERLARTETMPAGRDEAEARVLAVVEGAGLKGQGAQELDTIGLDRKALGAVLSRLTRAREIEKVGDLYVATSHLRALSSELRRLAGAGDAPAAIEVGWFKDRFGLTRRSAIPLLEWLDRTRVTRRQGDARVLIG